jgi:hypothetical protein
MQVYWKIKPWQLDDSERGFGGERASEISENIYPNIPEEYSTLIITIVL